MFSWYRNSKICIVHLSQTRTPYNMAQDPWFTRGWTLQELLALTVMKIFSKSWCPLTSKHNDKISDDKLGIPLWKIISEITQIPKVCLQLIVRGEVQHHHPKVQLLNFEPGTINGRERMVWVSKRKTTWIENMAYLTSPFPSHMGRDRWLFTDCRLKSCNTVMISDCSYGMGSVSSHNSMLATGPEAFSPLEQSLLVAGEEVTGSVDPTYTLMNYGLHIPLSIYEVQHIEALPGMHKGMWNLKMEGMGNIQVAFKSLSEDAKLTISILGNSPDNTSLAIVLIPPKISSKQHYKRMPTDVIKLPSPNVKQETKVIFIE
jgi:hypothetical protein